MEGSEVQTSYDYSQIEKRIAEYITPLLDFCFFAKQNQKREQFPCKDFLRKLNMESTKIQEFIDSYGAQKSERWFPFREAVAAGKTMSSVHYNLLHVKQSSSHYNLLDISDDFTGDTIKILNTIRRGIVHSCENFIAQALRCGVCPEEYSPAFSQCVEETLPTRFPADRKGRHVDKVGETVVYLATQFLNLSEEQKVKELLRRREACDFDLCIPDVVNEEKCRIVSSSFHNFQSMYDTYIFESDLESQNSDLPYLRGHISIIYHLLQIARDLIHYFIRHMSKLRRDTYEKLRFPLSQEELLTIIFDFFLHYTDLYMQAAKQLCRSMIRHYSVETEISVNIPNYRGFHVRPSTLIAKIVSHYGSTVTMELNDQKYDAGITLELFRANESINASKRWYIAKVLTDKQELKVPVPKKNGERTKEMQILFLNLMNSDEIILYDTNLSFHDLEPADSENMAAFASRYIKHFMSIAKIDIRSDLKIKFYGDNRALNDLKILAENGYGEDKYGNNIVLPPELSYLRG